MDKNKFEEYQAKFKPTAEDGEKLLQLKADLVILFQNNNRVSEWFVAILERVTEDEKRMDTLDNIIAKMTGERIELEKRIEGLENHLFRD
tara:strand:- start:447 stop:716 length:270 start_codon:yes stop_codon:yes gene_type:complete